MNEIIGILTSTISVLLVVCILAPSITKLAHALYEHHSEECTEADSLHVHEAELDCDFQKFHLSPQFTPFLIAFTSYTPEITRENTNNFYFFLSKYQKLHFVLRGPPQFS